MRALAWWGAAYLMGAFAVTLWGARSPRSSAGDAERVPVHRLRHDLERRAAVSRPPGAAGRAVFGSCGLVRRHAVSGLCGVRSRARGAVVGRDRALRLPHRVRTAARAPARSLRRAGAGSPFRCCTARCFWRRSRCSCCCPAGCPVDGLFALFAFETVIYVVGTAFVVVVMAKERVALVHKTAAMTDLLTGLFNRRAFLEAANRMIAQRGRSRSRSACCCSISTSSNRSTTASATPSATTRSRCSPRPPRPTSARPT